MMMMQRHREYLQTTTWRLDPNPRHTHTHKPY